MDDALVVVEDLADLDGDLGLLVAAGELPQVAGWGADADDRVDAQLPLHGLLDVLREAVDLPPLEVGVHLLDQHQVRLGDAQDKVVLAVREQILQHLDGADVGLVHLADQEHHSGHVSGEMQLLGADVNVAGEDVVRDDVLDERALVVLLLVAGLGLAHGDGGKDTDGAGHGVVPADENRIFELAVQSAQKLVGALGGGEDLVGDVPDQALDLIQVGADHPQLAAGDDKALMVHNAHRAVRGVF